MPAWIFVSPVTIFRVNYGYALMIGNPSSKHILLWSYNELLGNLSQTFQMNSAPGRVAQSVTCLVTDACLTADPGVASSIPARYHTFVEIDHEIISTVILLPSADLFKKGCCQLQAKVCAQITG